MAYKSLLSVTFNLILLALLPAANASAKIQTVVHLMLENRSFDAIFGFLNHNRDIDNLIGKRFCNHIDITNITSPLVCTGPNLNEVQNHNPDHKMSKAFLQTYSSLNPSREQLMQSAPMNGFVDVAAHSAFAAVKSNLSELAQVMSSFDPSKIPIHRTLAENFMVCDRWYSSVPGPTTPNRLFAHAATSGGLHYNDPRKMILGMNQRTIFNHIEESKGNLTWRSYYVYSSF
jgi:phospholipase C